MRGITLVLAVVVCIVVVAGVTGRNDNLYYEVLKEEVERFTTSTDNVGDVVTQLEVISYVLTNYHPNSRAEVNVIYDERQGWGLEYYGTYTALEVEENGNRGGTYGRVFYGFSSEQRAIYMKNRLAPLTWRTGINGLDILIWLVGVLLTIVILVVSVVLDVSVALLNLFRLILLITGVWQPDLRIASHY